MACTCTEVKVRARVSVCVCVSVCATLKDHFVYTLVANFHFLSFFLTREQAIPNAQVKVASLLSFVSICSFLLVLHDILILQSRWIPYQHKCTTSLIKTFYLYTTQRPFCSVSMLDLNQRPSLEPVC